MNPAGPAWTSKSAGAAVEWSDDLDAGRQRHERTGEQEREARLPRYGRRRLPATASLQPALARGRRARAQGHLGRSGRRLADGLRPPRELLRSALAVAPGPHQRAWGGAASRAAPPRPPRGPRRVPSLSIVIMAVGSRGDVQPFIPIGRRLVQRHRVRPAAPPRVPPRGGPARAGVLSLCAP